MRIVIVPDTNVYITRLDIISSFLEGTHPFHIDMLILKIVLDELDYNKSKISNAQKAISYIHKNESNEMLKIEGHVAQNGMEILLDYPSLAGINNNDDKIINIVSTIKYSVILTSDKNMLLKCKSKNVKCVFVEASQKYSDVNLAVLMSHTCAEEMEVSNELPESNLMRIAGDLLRPRIKQILINNIGPGYSIRYEKEVQYADMCTLLDICIRDFSAFSGYLHSSSKNLLIKINKIIKEESEEEKKKQALKNLLTIFKINNEL